MSPRHRSSSAVKVQITVLDSFLLHLATAALRVASMSMEMKIACHIFEYHKNQVTPCLAYCAHEIARSLSSVLDAVTLHLAKLCTISAVLQSWTMALSYSALVKRLRQRQSLQQPFLQSHIKIKTRVPAQSDRKQPKVHHHKPTKSSQSLQKASSLRASPAPSRIWPRAATTICNSQALTALQQITASKAKQLAAPAIDPKIIAKYTRLAVIPNLPVSGSTGPSSSSFDARPSVSSIPSQRPSSPAVTVASLSSTGVFDSKAVSQAPIQKPVSAKAAIDPRIIAKYSQPAVFPNLPVSGLTGPSSSSFDARPPVSSIPSQRPSSPAAAIASQSSTGVAVSKAVSQAPIQKPVFAKSAIDPKIIAKYSQRAVIPNLPMSGSTGSSSSSFDARPSVTNVPSQRPSSPAVTVASLSSTGVFERKAVSQAPSQKPVSAKSAIDPKIIAKYSRRAVIPNLPVSGSTGPSSSSFDAHPSVTNVPSQRPSSPAVTVAGPSSTGVAGSKAVSQAPIQKPVSAKSAIDPKIIAKYSRRAVIPDLPASGSRASRASSDAGKSVSSVSSQRPSVPAVALASLSSSSSSDIDSSQTVSQAPSQKSGYVKPAIDPKIIAKYSRRAGTADLPASASRPSSSSLNTSYSASKAATQRPISPAIRLTSPSSSDVDASESLINASTQRPQSPAVASSRPSSSSADTSKSISQAPSQRPKLPKATDRSQDHCQIFTPGSIA